MNDESESGISSSVVSLLTNPFFFSTNVLVQGDLLRSHDKRFENLPEDIRVNKASEDAGFMRKMSLVHFFMTIHDMDLTEFVRHLEVMKKCTPKDGLEETRKLAQY